MHQGNRVSKLLLFVDERYKNTIFLSTPQRNRFLISGFNILDAYLPLPPIGVFGFFVSLRIEMQLEMDLMAGVSCRVAGEKPGGIFCPSKKIVFLCIRINAL